jgi:hypothetical protein
VIRRLLPGGLALLLLGGCVYYNGMYNTKRLAGSARSAEREGRTFEATSLWGQVVTRADSLVVRHPDSKYVDEALMLKGTALARLGQCPSAMEPLSRVTQVRGSEDAVEDAYLALGRCQLELGDPGAAEIAIARVLQSRRPERRRDARLVHARALRLTGRPAESAAVLDSLSGDRVADERLLALAAAGRRDEALRIADSLVAQPDSGRVWDSLVVQVGRADPLAASRIVDRLIERPGTPPPSQTRWLIEDALRLQTVDTARAAARLEQAARLGADSPAGASARIELVRKRLARTAAVADLAAPARSLDSIVEVAGPTGEAGQLQAVLQRIQEAADSSAAHVTTADLRLFLAAEAARDTLAAPRLAAALFRQVADDWPDSPYTPKALLALGMVDPEWADSARAVLTTRYAASPYVAYVRGTPLPEYQALEDSLQAFSLQARPRPQPTRPIRASQPGGRRQQPGESEGQTPPRRRELAE